METLLQDIRYAVRSLLRSPTFTVAAVLTLALGIGANTAIFSVVNGVLLRPAPFADVDRIAMVWETDRSSGTTREPSSIPDFADFRERSRSFSTLAAFSPVEVNVASGNSDPERIAGLAVSQDFFATMGFGLLAGRTFTADEDLPGGPLALVISEELWERLYERSPAAIGRTLRLNDAEWEVVGIARSGSDFGMLQVLGAAAYQRGFADRGGRPRVDLWVPLRANPTASRASHPIFVVGRLGGTTSIPAAQSEMTAITAELERLYPDANVARGAYVEPFEDVVFGNVRTAMVVLVAAVAMVLLVACVNVANLLLVRASSRVREVTVRTALGAATGRLAQQFIVEGFVITGAGAALGTLFAYAAVDVLGALAPATIPRAGDITVDTFGLFVTAGVSVAIAIVFGLLPTFQARRLNLQSALHDSGRGAAGGRRQQNVRGSLVVAELAMATMLMVGGGLMIRSLWTLQRVDPGFDASGVLKAEFQLPASRYPQDFSRFPNWPERQRFQAEVVSRLAAMPGVEGAALATANPMDAGFTSSIRVVGREADANGWPEPSIRTVSAGYFETLRVPVLGGRAFEPADDAAAPTVIIVNEAARDRYFSGHEAIGSEINLWGSNRRVIGVVGNERFKGLATSAPPAVYMPLAQAPTPNAVLVRMASGDAAAAAPLVRSVIRDVDPQLALFGIESLSDTISGTLAQRRFTMFVLGAFALAALALAIIGVYGVLSYAVTQRTREIGIRVALGADLGAVRRMVVTDGARMAGIGVAIGLAGAFALSSVMETLLFGVGTRDPATFASVGLLLAAAAIAACWIPARRAAKVDPMIALRAE